jgi:hypothetical protein
MQESIRYATLSELDTLNTAVLYAKGADAATLTHGLAALPLAAYIATHPTPSFGECAVHVSASALDAVDGAAKTRAVALATRVLTMQERNLRDPNNKPTKEEWEQLQKLGIHDRPRFDDLTDKGYFYIVTSALCVRATKNSHKLTAVGLALNIGLNTPRDVLKEYDRHEADKIGVAVNAGPLGKKKTKLHNQGLAILTSPVARFSLGRALGVGLMTYGTLVGAKDALLYHRHVRHAKARAGVLGDHI